MRLGRALRQTEKPAPEAQTAQGVSNKGNAMTTVQVTLPDELAQKAANAGLLTTEAVESMLREQLRRRAGETLQAMWQRGPQEKLTPEIEQEILEEVRKVRAQARLRGATSLLMMGVGVLGLLGAARRRRALAQA